MSMTIEALEIIELDSARAPAPMLDHYIGLVRSSLVDATQEVAEHARTLLLKLEHLARSQRAQCIEPSGDQSYLAPWITLAEPVRAAA
jgi:hypothetical protein